jgi:hypothetical protein
MYNLISSLPTMINYNGLSFQGFESTDQVSIDPHLGASIQSFNWLLATKETGLTKKSNGVLGLS